jgi:hypothetical protein
MDEKRLTKEQLEALEFIGMVAAELTAAREVILMLSHATNETELNAARYEAADFLRTYPDDEQQPPQRMKRIVDA